MKVLRAIGAFFAKIGRWIANTAWIQPLLIVGGIFAVIFSIPYIKTAIENAQVDNTDHDYAYYSGYALDLDKDGEAEKLMQYLADSDYENIDKEFGSKFFLAFVKADCASCKECVSGFQNLSSNFSSWELDHEFKLHTILVDETDPDDDKVYLAKEIMKRNAQFFNDVTAAYGEESISGTYALYKNKESIKDTYTSNLKKLSDSVTETSDGITTRMVFMYDHDKITNEPTYFNVSGITAVLFDYTSLISDTVNDVTKGQLLRDCWSYGNIFDPDYLNNK